MRKVISILIALFMLLSISNAYADGAGDRNIQRVLNDIWSPNEDAQRVKLITSDLRVGRITIDNTVTVTGTVTADSSGRGLLSMVQSIDVLGTAKPLSTDSTAIREVIITAHPANYGIIYIGDSNVSSSRGMPLTSDGVSSITIKTDNITDISVDASGGPGALRATWIAILE